MAMAFWCLHPDCEEIVEPWPDADALARHATDTHTPPPPPSPPSPSPPPPPASSLHLVLDLDQTLITDIAVDDALAIALGGDEAAARVPATERLGVLAGLGVVPDAVHGEDLLLMRPHVGEFIEFALRRAVAVAVWSKAGREWVELALGTPPLAGHRDRLAFVWDGSRCTKVRGDSPDEMYGSRFWTKNLAKVWKARALKQGGWSRENTVLLDDDPDYQNFVLNYANGIKIPPFDAARHIEALVKAHARAAARGSAATRTAATTAVTPAGGSGVGDGEVGVSFDGWLPSTMRYFEAEVLTWGNVRPPEKRGWHLRYPPLPSTYLSSSASSTSLPSSASSGDRDCDRDRDGGVADDAG